MWDITVARLREEAPAAVELLELLSLVDSERIPLDILSFGNKWLAPVAPTLYQSTLGVNDAAGALAKYSMCYRADSIVSVHRLVQIVTQEKLTSEALREKLSALMTALRKMAPDYPMRGVDKWPWWHVFLRHALAALENSKRVDFVSADYAWLEREAGDYLASRGNSESALPIFASAVSSAERVFGAESAKYARALASLAGVVERRGEITKSINMRRRALEITTSDMGPEHANTMNLRSELGIALVESGASVEAQPILESYVEWAERTQHHEPEGLAHAYACLGVLLYRIGKFRKAREYIEKALALAQEARNPSQSTIATLMSDLSSVLAAEHEFKAAERLVRVARNIHISLYGKKNPIPAVTTTNLAVLLRYLDRNEEALQLAQEAADVLEKSDGARGPRVIAALANLAAVTAGVGDLTRSEVMYGKALAMIDDVYGTHGEISSRLLSNLAIAHFRAGNLQKARPLAARSLREAGLWRPNWH